MRPQSSVVNLNSLANRVLFRKSFLISCQVLSTSSTSSSSFSISGPKLRYLIHLYLVFFFFFAKGDRNGSNFTSSVCGHTQFSQLLLLKILSFCNVCFLALCKISDDYNFKYSCLSLVFYCIYLHPCFIVFCLLVFSRAV